MAGVLEPKQSHEEERVAKEIESESTSEAGVSNSSAAARAMQVRREREEQQAVPPSPVQNYEQTLGEVLGPAVYDAVSDLITLDSLASYARSGLESGLGSLGKLAEESDLSGASEYEEAIDKLQDALGPMAEEYVMQNGEELQERLQDFVDTRPVAVVALALLTAAAAVAADMDVPELQATFALTDQVDLTTKARLGTLRNITVERITARLVYHGANFRARAEGSYDFKKEQGTVEGGLDMELTEDLDLFARGQFRTTDESGQTEIDDHSVRGGLRWRPRDGLSIEGYGEHSTERGTRAGVKFIWEF